MLKPNEVCKHFKKSASTGQSGNKMTVGLHFWSEKQKPCNLFLIKTRTVYAVCVGGVCLLIVQVGPGLDHFSFSRSF